MSRYTGQDIIALARQAGASPSLARIMGAAAMAEGVGDSEAVGDGGHSRGPFQINDVHGLTIEARCDPAFATGWMYTHEFAPAFVEGARRGYTGEQLARWVCMAAERPYGWRGPEAPGLTSPAADNYARHWRALEDTMPDDTATATYDPSTARVAQTDDWSCSVAAAAWALRSLGVDVDYRDLEARALAAGIVSTADGLRDATGGPLANWLAPEFGLAAAYDAGVRWDWLVAHAGAFPILLGGRRWGGAGHWVAVRDVDEDGMLVLANPAEGYGGVFETLTERQFANVGPCSAVWLGREADMARIADLEQQVAASDSLVGVLRDAGRVARENIEQALAVDGLPAAAQDALANGALPAASTVERGGAPADGG